MAKKPGLKKNFMFSICYQILAIILPLITAPYIARVLGAANSGVYSKTHALARYFMLFAMLGVNNYGNRAIARAHDDRKKMSITFWEIYTFQALTAIICILLYLCFCAFLTKDNQFIYLMQGFYVLGSLFDINWCCFGMENFKLTTIRSSIIRIISAVFVFTFVKSRNDLWLYTFIISLSHVVSVLAVWPFVLKHIDIIRPTLHGIRKHIKPNLVLFWPVIAVSIYNLMDRIMLGWMSVDEEVGFYSYAESIVTIPTTLILALDNVVMPRMSNLFAKEGKSDHIKYLMSTVMMFAMFMSCAMAFGLAGVSDVFAPWFYGKEYIRCGYFIFLLSPVIIVKAWAGALRTQFIIPTGRDKIYVVSLTTGAVVNLILNALLIPRISGVGAIIGTLAAEFSVCFIQFFWCRRDIDIKNYLINGLSFCLIGAIMFCVVEALSHVSSHALVTMAVQIICGAIVYILLGCFYMIKIRRNPVLVNEGLKMLKIKYRFR